MRGETVDFGVFEEVVDGVGECSAASLDGVNYVLLRNAKTSVVQQLNAQDGAKAPSLMSV